MKKYCLLTMFLLGSSLANARSLQVMSYNVENLFDANHDVENGKDKKDWRFLPKNTLGKKEACYNEKNKRHQKECYELDWSNEKVELKISQIKDVVTKQNTTLPDFLGLVEVENKNIASKLAKKLGYEKFEISTSPDERGIDVVLMYKNNKYIKMISKTEHIVPVDYATRNILEVTFLIDNRFPLTIFVNHWPSLANPDSWRIQAAEILASRTLVLLKKNPQMNILSMGDFNTIDENNPHPFKTILFKDNLYKDVENIYHANQLATGQLKRITPTGSYFYSPKNQWNWLDHFFVNKNLMDGPALKVLVNSFEVYSPAFLTHTLLKKKRVGEGRNVEIVLAPKRFEPKGKTKKTMGYSDHFAILVKLEYPERKFLENSKNKSETKLNIKNRFIKKVI